jgi:hypothetical protein
VEDVRELLPLLLAPALTALGWFGRQWMERRMREATAAKTEAEAKLALAQAEKTLAESDGEAAKVLLEVIGSLRTLNDKLEERVADVETEQEKVRAENTALREGLAALQAKYDALLQQFEWYRHGTAVLIRQIRKLAQDPDWTPDMARPADGEKNGGK